MTMPLRNAAARAYREQMEAPSGPAGLIAQHLPLARRVAWHVHGKAPGAIEVEELQQMAVVALIEAANAHQGDDATFPGYASMRIKGALLDEMRRRAAMTRGALRRRREMLNAQEALSASLGRQPTRAEIAAHLDIDEAEFSARCDEAEGIRYSSMDEVYSDHSMLFADEQQDAFDGVADEQMRALLARHIGGLPEREALVLQLYFVEELNLVEIAEVFDLTSARICQLKASALSKLRKALQDSI
ncbi:FliA/WhiG family RNA polymerase sigma factor [Pacificimonas flava]|uniref:RNA polymerase sigma factor for flagellar operon n=1 Tax=Pacificimonas flava TaxID=1234595 RepID=M2TC18_9SPHN|nr:FliA/WhiG family RNA polymerase sigma factor [Pacificimonas flava]EMD84174.1 RNA polymerase sigma factor for flagellar operon [Pacificimonas flava]MBB5279948.1 RNA polymerase sigma factor for flagellar operon FliA [Pacificimonas flava]